MNLEQKEFKRAIKKRRSHESRLRRYRLSRYLFERNQYAKPSIIKEVPKMPQESLWNRILKFIKKCLQKISVRRFQMR